jgi:uncharacterized membrane protein
MESKKIALKKYAFLTNFKSVHRLLFCLGLAVLVFILLVLTKVEVVLCIIIAWSSFSLFMILISWITFFATTAKQVCIRAKEQDESRAITFLIVLISVCISLFGTLILIRNTDEGDKSRELHIIASLLSVVFSWILLHTIYTLRYAHLYYSTSLKNPKSHPGGLDFPETEKPDYIDFAYFAFVIGMTFQVSDVRVTSGIIRRFVLLHGLIAFVYNTIVVALTINVIAGLKSF